MIFEKFFVNGELDATVDYSFDKKEKIFRKPLPKFIQESFKRSTISKSKTTPALPPPTPPTGKNIVHLRLTDDLFP